MITSKDNQYFRLMKEIAHKKYREEYGLFFAEGKRLVEDLVAAGLNPHLALYDEGFSDYALLELLSVKADRMFSVSTRLLHQLAETKNEQGIMAAFPLLCPKLEDYTVADEGMLLILNGVSDPGNLGAIIRSAAAAGIDAVVMETGCVDLYHPKVIRATMGTIARIPVFRNLHHEEIISYLEKERIKIYLADAGDAIPYDCLPLDEKIGIVLGNEGNGISGEWRNRGFNQVMIPMENGVESLNVAMAASIISFGRYIRRKNLK